jgi:uncharacterized protein YdhG (YjbR/CyaY superfamily)
MASAVLTWNANTEPDLAGYRIYRGFGLAAPILLASVGRVTTYTDSTLPNISQDVTYNLTAFDSNGNESAHSVEVTKTVDVNPPAAPTGLTVVLS